MSKLQEDIYKKAGMNSLQIQAHKEMIKFDMFLADRDDNGPYYSCPEEEEKMTLLEDVVDGCPKAMKIYFLKKNA